ncbi:metal-dependent hydrolase family protein [Flavihumibacter petaseus]|uniref:Peptidase M38 family protein n=1 Tax=Flavihumibacter petaseus NBRC 106054 TaxID=1220578 RepID=A0A0E9MYQ1_9BACT|nr:amidohydrolase family protein [Flavihumibacter petaseus]GAO42541.1 peptidase M38 family protein [Flavihumibacter petaseus NBRC 106054]
MRLLVSILLLTGGLPLLSAITVSRKVPQPAVTAADAYLLLAARVFDGEEMHPNWAVLVEQEKITAVGPVSGIKAPKGATRIDFGDATLMPGLIEGHGHLFLYPYNIRSWDDQVLKETDAFRTIRAVQHAKATLQAGFTTLRDLGTEGAGYADVALRDAISQGLAEGPRLLVAGRAIVATGAYGPKGYDDDSHIMLGAEEADGNNVIKVVRGQMGHGTDVVKVYADYFWGPQKEDLPTFSEEELRLMAVTAKSGGRPLVAHAGTNEGMRRAVEAGVETIEHGDEMDETTAALLKAHGVYYFPTLAATEAVAQYRGWRKGAGENVAVNGKKKSFAIARKAGVRIGMGGDVGVYGHGTNVIEMELMAEYGMAPLEVLKAATSVNADAFHLEKLCGRIKPGLMADLIVVKGDPSKQVSDCRRVSFVMKGGIVFRKD